MNEQLLKQKTVAVVGGGTMGCAIAGLLAENDLSVNLWVYEEELVRSINEEHENSIFLPGIKLSHRIHATNSLEEALTGVQVVLSVTPSQVIRTIWKEASKHLEDDAVVVCASKGVETGTMKLLSQVMEESTGLSQQSLGYLSGPSFAREILEKQPTAVVIASENEALAHSVQHLVSTPYFRAYTTDDVVGVELGGAIKNVVAIAVGVAEGMGLGINSRSALITRGLAEITRLSIACGAQPATLSGLAGMGDLVLTCNGHLSRNLQVGIRLGKGEKIDEITSSMRMIAEGVATAHSVLDLAQSKSVDMPVAEIVVQLLNGQITPREAIPRLMTRRLRSEKE